MTARLPPGEKGAKSCRWGHACSRVYFLRPFLPDNMDIHAADADVGYKEWCFSVTLRCAGELPTGGVINGVFRHEMNSIQNRSPLPDAGADPKGSAGCQVVRTLSGEDVAETAKQARQTLRLSAIRSIPWPSLRLGKDRGPPVP